MQPVDSLTNSRNLSLQRCCCYCFTVVSVGIPSYLQRRLQSVLNAAARLIYRPSFRDHITDALVSLHWLRVPERIKYKVAVLTYKALHNTAPRYPRATCPCCWHTQSGHTLLCSSVVTDRLTMPCVRLHTVGNGAFPIAAPMVWNSLSNDIVSSEYFYTFCRLLKTFLFSVSFSDLIL